jgi:hypothetical protein
MTTGDGRTHEDDVGHERRALRQEIRALRVEVHLWSGLIVAVIVAMALLNRLWH